MERGERQRPDASVGGGSAGLIAGRVAMRTDVGPVRRRNEDAAYIDPEGRFFIVGDGVSGFPAGDVASALAVDIVRRELDASRSDLRALDAAAAPHARERIDVLLATAVNAANAGVFERSYRDADTHGMATTLTIVLLALGEAFVAHVGDSRAYLIRDRAPVQLTNDHNWAQAMTVSGMMTRDEAKASPVGHVLANAIGMERRVTIELGHQLLRPRDRVLVCTDGLYRYFEPEELAVRVSARAPVEALSELVALATHRGGHDNITGVIVEIIASPPMVPARPATPRPRPAVSATMQAAPPAPRPLPRTRAARGTAEPNPLALVTHVAIDDFIERSLTELDDS